MYKTDSGQTIMLIVALVMIPCSISNLEVVAEFWDYWMFEPVCHIMHSLMLDLQTR